MITDFSDTGCCYQTMGYLKLPNPRTAFMKAGLSNTLGINRYSGM